MNRLCKDLATEKSLVIGEKSLAIQLWWSPSLSSAFSPKWFFLLLFLISLLWPRHPSGKQSIIFSCSLFRPHIHHLVSSVFFCLFLSITLTLGNSEIRSHSSKCQFSPSSNTYNASLHGQFSSSNPLLNSNIIITVTLFQSGPLGTEAFRGHNYWACAFGACAPQQERPW